MSDTDLRTAERLLAADPLNTAARMTYARAWDRAGRPVRGRDPRREPRPGDVVELVVTTKLGRSHAGHDLGVLTTRVRRFVSTVRLDERGRVERLTRTPSSAGVPEPGRQGWRPGTKTCSIAAWRRAVRTAEVAWIEPDVWGEWHLAPRHFGEAGKVTPGCVCRACQGALRAKIAASSPHLAAMIAERAERRAACL